MKIKIFENKNVKGVVSETYNYMFDKRNGNFARWGKTREDDPQFAPAPEIADIEISTVCSGVSNIGPCKFCYKGNTPVGENMSIETFKKLFSKFPKTLTQIAFGIGNIDGNPDMFPIFEHSRKNGVIPNVTINGDRLSDEYAKKLSEVCGAVAVSYYDKDTTYNAIKKLTDLGMTQINIHFMISEERFELAKELLEDTSKDDRLAKLNAIVFLGIKNKGRAEVNKHTPLDKEKFKELIDYAIKNNIGVGFDSCSAGKFINAIKDSPNYKKFLQLAEPCESGLFSSYFNVRGEFYPCSFMEGMDKWTEGINALADDFDFHRDLWNSPKVVEWRNRLLELKRECPTYKI